MGLPYSAKISNKVNDTTDRVALAALPCIVSVILRNEILRNLECGTEIDFCQTICHNT